MNRICAVLVGTVLLLSGCAQQPSLAERADEVVTLLAARQFDRLAGYVHPEKGVRFSPSAFIDLQSDRVLSADQLAAVAKDKARYHWGLAEGSGAPIELSFADYVQHHVYDADFAQAEKVAVDKTLGQGTSVNNLAEVYPGSRFVEYHFPGFDPQFEGLDWKSLRLVFEEQQGTWFLVGIIHAQWSI